MQQQSRHASGLRGAADPGDSDAWPPADMGGWSCGSVFDSHSTPAARVAREACDPRDVSMKTLKDARVQDFTVRLQEAIKATRERERESAQARQGAVNRMLAYHFLDF